MRDSITDITWFQGQLVESSSGVNKLRGVFQRADVKNANGRVYPKGIWERIIKEGSSFMDRIKNRAVLGHLEHPADGVTDLGKAAVLITGVSMDDKGQVIGEAEILDTPNGKIVETLVRHGVRIGISSRGKGSVGPDGVVSEDYDLETFDIVNSPSTPGAHPTAVEESASSECGLSGKGKITEDVGMSMDILTGLETRVNQLAETDVSTLASYARGQFLASLTEASVALSTLSTAHPEFSSVIGGLQESLNAKRKEVNTSTGAAKPVTESKTAVTECDGKEGDGDGDEDDEGEDDEGVPAFSAESLEDARALYDAMASRLSATQERCEKLEDKLDSAISVIQQLSAKDVGAEVDEAIQAVVTVVPELAPCANILSRCESVDEVMHTARAFAEDLGEDACDKFDAEWEAVGDDDDGTAGYEAEDRPMNVLVRNGRRDPAERPQALPPTPRDGNDPAYDAYFDGDDDEDDDYEEEEEEMGETKNEDTRNAGDFVLQRMESTDAAKSSAILAESVLTSMGGL